MTMRRLFFLLALWNTVVFLANVTIVLPHLSPEACVFLTLKSQLLPIAISLAIGMMIPSRGSFLAQRG